MIWKQKATVLAIVSLIIAATLNAAPQIEGKYKAKLFWVPIGGAARGNVTGKGSVTAFLAGKRLSLTGTFEGLSSPATVARLHRGVAKGARGPVISDLAITGAERGTINGSLELTSDQLDDLRQGRLYIQLHSEKGVSPDGSNLWGWLLPQ